MLGLITLSVSLIRVRSAPRRPRAGSSPAVGPKPPQTPPATLLEQRRGQIARLLKHTTHLI